MTGSGVHGADSAVTGAEVVLRSNDDIQGNILAGFNTDHQAFLFLGFGGADFGGAGADQARANARAWLTELTDPAGRQITTNKQVVDFYDHVRSEQQRLNTRRPPDLRSVWAQVSLTYPGLVTLAPDLEPDLDRYQAFRSGPAGNRQDEDNRVTTTAALLGDEGDSHPDHWVVGRPGRAPDALLTIAAHDENELLDRLKTERERAARTGLRVLWEELGHTLPGARRGTEHFGFKDGISQPGIRGFTSSVRRGLRMEDAEQPGSAIIASGEFLLGRVRERRDVESEYPSAPEWMRDGSFQVFRRLVQDVPAWYAAMERLGPPSLTATELAARAMGRWPDGKPLGSGGDRGDNDFDYADDLAGHHTPRWAHIRKMYARNDSDYGDRPHRILRRGIPFGSLYDPAAASEEGGSGERGLLFNAFMANIAEQFEFLQRRWANNPKYPSMPLDTSVPDTATEDGVDPVIGAATHPCLLRLEGGPDRWLNFGRFVRTTGAVYAFAPPMSTLRRLATGEQLPG